MRIAAGILPFFSQVRGHIKNLLKLMQSMMEKSHASSVLEKLFMLFRSLFSLLS